MSQTVIPPYVAPSEQGIDRIITVLRNALLPIVSIANVLGRIKPQWVDGKLEPWLYTGQEESYKAYPNDELALMNYSCLYAHDDEQATQGGILVSRSVSVIVWLNMDQLPPGQSVESVKLSVIKALHNLACVEAISYIIKDQTVSGGAAIFPGFDMSGFESKYLSYPYAGFRVEFKVHYKNNCL